jgi:glucose-6-phosphate 1-dehydrogenase
LVKPTTESIGSSVCRGQYRNFVGEPGVPEGSETETYFKIRVGIDNSRWQGVPFFLESGKGVSESLSDIKVFFKSKPVCFAASPSVHCGNVVSFRIQPNEGVSVTFWAKRPGLSTDPEPKTLVVDFAKTNDTSDAYERVLFDAILGDQTLFTSTDEVRAAWQFITSILTLWKDLPLHKYDKGASGPVCSLA